MTYMLLPSTLSQEMLEDLKELFKEDGVEITDQEAYEVGMWLLARVMAVEGLRIPKHKKELWDQITAQEKHPHGK